MSWINEILQAAYLWLERIFCCHKYTEKNKTNYAAAQHQTITNEQNSNRTSVIYSTKEQIVINSIFDGKVAHSISTNTIEEIMEDSETDSAEEVESFYRDSLTPKKNKGLRVTFSPLVNIQYFTKDEFVCGKSNTVEPKAEEKNKLLRVNIVPAGRVGVHWPKPPRPLKHYNYPNKATVYHNTFNVAPKINRGLKINFIETENTGNRSNKINVYPNIFSEWPEPIPVENTTEYSKMGEPFYQNIFNVAPPKVNRGLKRNFIETIKKEPIYQNTSSLGPKVDRRLKLKLAPVAPDIDVSSNNDFLLRNNLPKAPKPPPPPTDVSANNNFLCQNNLPKAPKPSPPQRTAESIIYEDKEYEESANIENMWELTTNQQNFTEEEYTEESTIYHQNEEFNQQNFAEEQKANNDIIYTDIFHEETEEPDENN